MPLPNHLAKKSELLQRLDNEPALLQAIEAKAKANDIAGVAEALQNAGINDALVHFRGEEPGNLGAEPAMRPPRCCIYFGEFICVCWH
jgi:hypothetical protein